MPQSWPTDGKRHRVVGRKSVLVICPETVLALNPCCVGSALVVLLSILPLHGCAWRIGADEHYLGPVLYRYSPPLEDKPAISQVVAIGVLGESGRQWGLSFGVVERTTVSPQLLGGTDPGTSMNSPRWSTPLNPLGSPVPYRWHLSPFYLCVEGVQPLGLLARRLSGFQLASGPEVRAASLGIVSLIRIEVPTDAISLIRFDAHAPLATRFSVWRAHPDRDLPLTNILEGLNP